MYALIDKATNKILRVSNEAAELSAQKPFVWVECPEEVGFTWTYDGTSFAPPTLEPEIIRVPSEVSMRQARLALYEVGLLSSVSQTIAAISDESQKTKAEIEWEYATSVRRDSSLVQGLIGGLGLTEEMVDNLFIMASQL